MRRLPEQLLREHGVYVLRDGKPEPAWQQVLRLNQSLWREEQGLDPKVIHSGTLGSMLAADVAAQGLNLMSDAARTAACREVDAAKDAEAQGTRGKVVDGDRLYENLLTSQALCFSIFGELQSNLTVASKVVSALLDTQVQVTRIELEHSPGRGDPTYTGDHSAADAFVEYTTTQEDQRGFLSIETKYFENLLPPRNWRDPYRRRYSDVATQMGCFEPDADQQLRVPTREQLWRDHLLAGSILLHPDEPYDEGHFVIVYPTINELCHKAVEDYRTHLTNEDTFKAWTLESVVAALLEHADYDWAWSLRDRYLDFYRVDHVYQEHYLELTTGWATTVRSELGDIQGQEGHRVWFRPTTTGFGMVGLLIAKPQLGTSYTSTAKVLTDFESEFSRQCDGPGPKRYTPEKRIQSYLVADALTHERRMEALDEALVFLTDELVIPSIEGDQRLDMLALRRLPQGARLVLIELKSERAMTELLRQAQTYSGFLDNHMTSLSDLASAILGEPVEITEPCERWVVWPATGNSESEPRIPEFTAHGIRVVGYRESGESFEFDLAPEVR